MSLSLFDVRKLYYCIKKKVHKIKLHDLEKCKEELKNAVPDNQAKGIGYK